LVDAALGTSDARHSEEKTVTRS